MKTDDLKAKGLTDEQVNFVMAENGKDIKELQDKNNELEKTKTQLEADKTALEKEKTDKEKIIEDLQKGTITKEEYDQKVKELEESIEKTKDDNTKNNILNSMYKEFDVIETEENKLAISTILKTDEMQLNKEKTEVIGLKEAFEKLKEGNPHFFGNKLNGFEPGDKGTGKGGTETNEAVNIAQERNKIETAPTESKYFN